MGTKSAFCGQHVSSDWRAPWHLLASLPAEGVMPFSTTPFLLGKASEGGTFCEDLVFSAVGLQAEVP